MALFDFQELPLLFLESITVPIYYAIPKIYSCS